MKKFLTLIFTIVFLSACNCDDDNNCVAVQNPDCVCPENWEPVCGCDGVTYSNTCFAECAGIDEFEDGECE